VSDPDFLPGCHCKLCAARRAAALGQRKPEMPGRWICPRCGDGRCPHIDDHRNKCLADS